MNEGTPLDKQTSLLIEGASAPFNEGDISAITPVEWKETPPVVQDVVLSLQEQVQKRCPPFKQSSQGCVWKNLKPWLRVLVPLWLVLSFWLAMWAQRVVCNSPHFIPTYTEWVIYPLQQLGVLEKLNALSQSYGIAGNWIGPNPPEWHIFPGVTLWLLVIGWVMAGALFFRFVGRDDVQWLQEGPYRKTTIPLWFEVLCVVVIMALAIYFRGRYIQAEGELQNPPGLNHDAAWSCIFANDVAQGLNHSFWNPQRPSGKPFYEPFATTGAHGETLYFYWQALFIYVFGAGRRAMELCSVTTGCLTVLFFYMMVRFLFSVRMAIVSSLILATSGYHVVYSWSSWRALTLPIAWCLAGWVLFRALRARHWWTALWWWVFGGFSAALVANTYNSGRYGPALLLVLLPFMFLPDYRLIISWVGVAGLSYVLYQKKYTQLSVGAWVLLAAIIVLPMVPLLVTMMRNWWRGWAQQARARFLEWRSLAVPIFGMVLAVFVCWVCLWPMVQFAARHRHYWEGRAQSILIFNQMRRAGAPCTPEYFEPLRYNFMTAPLIYNRRAGGDDWFVWEPLLHYPAAVLFGIGVAFALVHCYRKPVFFLWASFGYGMLVNLLTRPNGNRPFMALPAVYVFIGLALVMFADGLHLAVSGFLKKDRRRWLLRTIALSPVVAILVVHVVTNYYTWVDPQTRKDVFGFYPDATKVAEFSQPYYAEGYELVFWAGNWPRDTLTYLLYPGEGIRYPAFHDPDFSGERSRTFYYAYTLDQIQQLIRRRWESPVLFVIERNHHTVGVRNELRRRYPRAEVRVLSTHGHPRHVPVPEFAEAFIVSDPSDLFEVEDDDLSVVIQEEVVGVVNAFQGGAGSQGGQFYSPVGVTTDSAGNLYVADMSNHRVQKFDPNGNFLDAWGQHGPGPTDFRDPQSLCIASDGFLYVLDTWNHRVMKYSTDGVEQGMIKSGFYGPRSMTTHGNRLYVADSGRGRVVSFRFDGSDDRVFGEKGSGLGQLDEVVGIAVHPDGEVLMVADTSNDRLVRFRTNGEFLGVYPVPGWDDGRLREAHMTGDQQYVYLARPDLGRIEAFTWDGNPAGILAQGLVQPTAMVIVGNRMIVTERDMNRLRVIELNRDEHGRVQFRF